MPKTKIKSETVVAPETPETKKDVELKPEVSFEALLKSHKALLASYDRLIRHLVKRGLMPNPDLEQILEPLGIKMDATRPGVFFYDHESDENA